jgi:hypothetical protein
VTANRSGSVGAGPGRLGSVTTISGMPPGVVPRWTVNPMVVVAK